MKLNRFFALLLLLVLSATCALAQQDVAALKDMSTEDLITLFHLVGDELDAREEELLPSPASDFLTVSNATETYIRAYLGTDDEVVIPNEINGKPVTVIDEKAFKDIKTVKRITLPDTLRRIEREAFSFTNYENDGVLVFPKSLEYIAGSAMPSSFAKITGIVFQSSCILSDTSAMAYMDEVELIYIAKDCNVEIGRFALRGYPMLRTVIIPASVTNIHDEAFLDNPRMTIVTPEGSYAQKYAERLMIPCDTASYEELNAYYSGLYIR